LGMYAVCSWSVTPQANPLYNLADKSREAGAVSPALALFSSHITSGCGPALRRLLAASDYESTCRDVACLVPHLISPPFVAKVAGVAITFTPTTSVCRTRKSDNKKQRKRFALARHTVYSNR